MGARFGLKCTVAITILCATATLAEAQVVSFTGSGYVSKNPPEKSTVAPYGTYSVEMNKAGQYRVAVDYGILSNGSFAPYAAPLPAGIPQLSYSAVTNVGVNGGNFNWSVAAQDGSGINQDTQIRARLQRSTDNGLTWATVNEGYLQALPTPPPPLKN